MAISATKECFCSDSESKCSPKITSIKLDCDRWKVVTKVSSNDEKVKTFYIVILSDDGELKLDSIGNSHPVGGF